MKELQYCSLPFCFLMAFELGSRFEPYLTEMYMSQSRLIFMAVMNAERWLMEKDGITENHIVSLRYQKICVNVEPQHSALALWLRMR